MKRRARVLAMIMAGGKGERLHPLTRDRSKPAVPFAGRYRIVDFVLSNFVNSDMLSLYALVSMGNYLFRRQALVDALLVDARRSTDHDFGRSIIPELVPGARVYGYDFQGNEVPGVKPYEEQGYWRDVGTLSSYWEAHMDL